MEEKRQVQTQSNDEIDLRELFRSIGQFFRNIGNSILKGMALLRRTSIDHARLIISIVVLGIIVGFSSTYVFSPFYESSMLLKAEHLNIELVDNSVEKLDQLAREENHEVLGAVLNLDSSEAAGIMGFSVKPFISEEDIIEIERIKERLQLEMDDQEEVDFIIEQLEIQNIGTFKISVFVFNPEILDKLEESVASYFKNNPYVSKRLEVEMKNKKEKRAKLQTELVKMDSLKKVLFRSLERTGYERRKGSNNVILSEAFTTDPLQVFRDDLRFYDQLQELEEEIFIEPSFEVVDGFVQYSKPASAGKLEILVISILISLGVAYLLIGIIAFNKYLGELA